MILDILPERNAETFARWLQEHPGVEVISRNRGGSYADGAAIGAPDTVQVVDRWHLLKNLGDVLTNSFELHRTAIVSIHSDGSIGLPHAGCLVLHLHGLSVSTLMDR